MSVVGSNNHFLYNLGKYAANVKILSRQKIFLENLLENLTPIAVFRLKSCMNE